MPELVTQITDDILAANDTEINPFVFLLPTQTETTTSSIQSADLAWFLRFLDTVTNQSNIGDEMEDLLAFCRKMYSENESELRKLEKFKKDYDPNNALQWYTKDMCLYRLLNKALRIQCCEAVRPMRMFFRDISVQLRKVHEAELEAVQNNNLSPKIVAHRGQCMTKEELDNLSNSVGQLVSTTTFLSASKTLEVARFFRDPNGSNKKMVQVMFEITADRRVKTRDFADISSESSIRDENEILFSPGTVFRIECVDRDNNDNFHNIKLTLCSEDHRRPNEAINNSLSKMSGQDPCIEAGNLLLRMDQPDAAEKWFSGGLKQSEESPNEIQRLHVLDGLGHVAGKKGNYKEALEFHQYVLRLKIRLLPADSWSLGVSYVNTGNAYYDNNEYEKALTHYYEALNVFFNYPYTHPNFSKTFNNIGVVFAAKGDAKSARKYVQWAISVVEKSDFQHNPEDVATYISNLGSIVRSQKYYSYARKLQEEALKRRSDCLPAHHIHIAISYYNLGFLYRDLGDYRVSLCNFSKALKIMNKCLPESHPDYLGAYKHVCDLQSLVTKVKCPNHKAAARLS